MCSRNHCQDAKFKNGQNTLVKDGSSNHNNNPKIGKDGRPVAAQSAAARPGSLEVFSSLSSRSNSRPIGSVNAERQRSRVRSRVERHSNHRDTTHLEMSQRLVDHINLEASRQLVDCVSGNEWTRYGTNRRLVKWSRSCASRKHENCHAACPNE